MERKTKIVATIGPASRDRETLVRMVEAGMDVARLNFSHGSHEQHAETAELGARRRGPRRAPGRAAAGPAGPEAAHRRARRGRRRAQGRRLASRSIAATTTARSAPRATCTITWPGLARAVVARRGALPRRRQRPAARARRARRAPARSTREVEIGGTVASRQGLNVPGPGVDMLPAVPDEDLAHLQAGIKIGVDLVALSFVRRPEDVTFLREHTRTPLIAKIEKPQAVDNAEEILRVSDCVMIARGDLGIELPIEEVPVVQKRLIALAGALARPVDHRDADARLDGQRLAPDARRGRRRRQRDPRRHRRRDALRRRPRSARTRSARSR